MLVVEKGITEKFQRVASGPIHDTVGLAEKPICPSVCSIQHPSSTRVLGIQHNTHCLSPSLYPSPHSPHFSLFFSSIYYTFSLGAEALHH